MCIAKDAAELRASLKVLRSFYRTDQTSCLDSLAWLGRTEGRPSRCAPRMGPPHLHVERGRRPCWPLTDESRLHILPVSPGRSRPWPASVGSCPASSSSATRSRCGSSARGCSAADSTASRARARLRVLLARARRHHASIEPPSPNGATSVRACHGTIAEFPRGDAGLNRRRSCSRVSGRARTVGSFHRR